jgi:hypothetical protein
MVVKFNVGGTCTVYWTTVETLNNRGENMLTALIKHSNPAQMVDGGYFLDRDPLVFRWILLYLRGSNILPLRSFRRHQCNTYIMHVVRTYMYHINCPFGQTLCGTRTTTVVPVLLHRIMCGTPLCVTPIQLQLPLPPLMFTKRSPTVTHH